MTISLDYWIWKIFLKFFDCMFYFTVLGAAFETNWDINSKKYSSELLDFAFLKGGTFSVDFFGNNIMNTVIVLFNHTYHYEHRNVLKHQLGFCWGNKTNSDFLQYRVKSFEYDRWNITINKSDIYHPIIYNCPKKKIRFLVTYSNPQSYLDGRKIQIPHIALAFSVAYIILTFLWISNFFKYPKINILLTYCLSAVTALKAVSIALVALYWIEKSERKNPRKFFDIYYYIDAFITANIYIFNALATQGFGTVKPFFKMEDYYRISTILIYTILSTPSLNTTKMYVYRIYIFIRLATILSYSSYVVAAKDAFSKVYQKFYNIELIALKCKHVQKFILIHINTCMLLTGFMLISFFARNQACIQFACDEILVFLVLYVDYVYFKIRDEYIRPVQEIDYDSTSYYEFPLGDEFDLLQLQDIPIE